MSPAQDPNSVHIGRKLLEFELDRKRADENLGRNTRPRFVGTKKKRGLLQGQVKFFPGQEGRGADLASYPLAVRIGALTAHTATTPA